MITEDDVKKLETGLGEFGALLLRNAQVIMRRGGEGVVWEAGVTDWPDLLYYPSSPHWRVRDVSEKHRDVEIVASFDDVASAITFIRLKYSPTVGK